MSCGGPELSSFAACLGILNDYITVINNPMMYNQTTQVCFYSYRSFDDLPKYKLLLPNFDMKPYHICFNAMDFNDFLDCVQIKLN